MAREVDKLYGLPPEQFTAARDALARAARAAGDRDLAGEVAALRRPTVAAWLLNQLARQRADEVDQFVALGVELREAAAALDAERAGDLLRDLSTQRRRLVRALVDQARGWAAQHGRRVTEDVLRSVEETLHAALADAEVARLLRAGRLTTAVSHSGFAPATEGAAAGPAPAPAPRRRTRGRSTDEVLERRLAEASAEARSAAEQRDRAVAKEEGARRTATDAARKHDRLTSAVAQARDTAAAARAALAAAESELASAEAHAAHAEEVRRAADDAARAATEHRRAAEEAAERARRRVSVLTQQAERHGT